MTQQSVRIGESLELPRLLDFVFFILPDEVRYYFESWGYLRALAPRRGQGIIVEDQISRGLVILGYVFFVLVLIFAIDFQAYSWIYYSLGALAYQLVGERLSAFAGAARARPARPRLGNTFLYVILDLGLFGALDIVGAAPWSLPGLPLPSLSSVSLGQVLTLGSLFGIQIAIAEEEFFRGGAANLGGRYGGPLLGIMTSAAFFGAFHIPGYFNSPLELLIITADGAVLAWSDFDNKRILPSMIAHILNNLLVVIVAAGLGAAVLGL